MAELEDAIDTRDPNELEWWLAYDSLWPIGERRADIRAAIQTCLIANVHRDSKRRAAPFTPLDWAPYLDKPKPKLLPASALLGQLRAYQERYTVKRTREWLEAKP